MRILLTAALAIGVLAAPVAHAEPGIWPDCDPNDSAAMAECAMPPASPCAPGTISSFSGINGGAFYCTASGQWAWRAMDYTDWLQQRCAQLAKDAGQTC